MANVIVPGCEHISRAEETPGFIIVSKPAVIPVDFFIRHCYVTPAVAFGLPVRASRHTLSTQNLLMVLKPLRMLLVKLLLFHRRHFFVSVGQQELSVCRVWIQGEIAGIFSQSWSESRMASVIQVEFVQFIVWVV